MATTGPPAHCGYIDALSSGACVAMVAQYGDNGTNPAGPVELKLRNQEAHRVWDSTPSLVMDSDWIAIQLSVPANGGATLGLADGTTQQTVADNSFTHGRITSVQISAGVIAVPKRRLSWRGITVQYFKNGQPTETLSRPTECQPIADTYVVGGSAFKAVEYKALVTDNDSVVVTGEFRLTGDRPDMSFEFGIADFMAEIRVFAANCVPA